MDLIRISPTARPGPLPPIPSRPRLAASATFRARLDAVYLAYLFMHRALKQDQITPARKAAKRLLANLPGVVSRGESVQVKKAWAAAGKKLAQPARRLAAASDVRTARKHFVMVSSVMIATVQTLGMSGALQAYRFHCPRENNNRGAEWLQDTPTAENPYYGAAMLRCGSRRPL
jgi:Cu(I)/Ag(I) efflux system membrane fusion protein